MKEFWRTRSIFDAKSLALMGLLVALTAVMAPVLNVHLTPEVRLFSFTYLPGAMAAILFGPVAGLFVGFAGDFVSWLFTLGNGQYFPGFALSAMLQNLIYAAFLFRLSRVSWRPARTLWRVLSAQAFVLVMISLGLNMLWLNLMYGNTAGEIYTFFRIALRLAQFPIDVALLYLCTRLATRIVIRKGAL